MEIKMLQFITHYNDRYDYIAGARLFLHGGGTWVQLRMKDAEDAEVIAIGKQLRQLCDEYRATLIIDDYVHLVDIIHADGVHLGKNDMSPSEARSLLGDKAIIGGTANTFADIERLVAQGVNYIGLGPFRFTTTKKGLSTTLGLEGYEAIKKQCVTANIHTPIVAIGGIDPTDIAPILAIGIEGIALSGTILNAPDPIQQTSTILQIIQ